MSILNATQQRHLYFGLMHLDKQLCDLEDILNQAQTPPMFPRFRHDITPELQREIETGVAAIRAAMRQLMQSEELTPEAAGLGALQGIRSQLTFAEIGIEELGPRNMRGYGALDDLPAQALEEMVSGLRAPVSVLLNRLTPGDAPAPVLAPERKAAAAAASAQAISALAASTEAVIDAIVEALARAVEANPKTARDELPMIALDVLTERMLACRTAVAAALGTGVRLPQPDIEGLAWRLDKPRLGNPRARFRSQLEARAGGITSALQAYATRLRLAAEAITK